MYKIIDLSAAACDSLDDDYLQNGYFLIVEGNNFTSTDADVNVVVKFFCDDGYELVGPVISYCTIAGWTHEENGPSCQGMLTFASLKK